MKRLKILVIQHKMIGDVVASTVICEFLKKHNKDVEVHFLANTGTLEVLENNPNIDKVIEFKKAYTQNRSLFKGFVSLIQSQRYDVVIDAYCKLLSAHLSKKSKAPIRVSYDKWYSRFFFTRLVKRRKVSQTIASTAIENRLLLVNEPSKVNDQIITPKIYLTDDEKFNGKELLKKHNLFGKRLTMLSIFGSSDSKSYPAEYMSQLISQVASSTDTYFLLNFIPNQLEDVRKIYSIIADSIKHRIFFEPYGTNLRQFLSLLYWCDALIGNEGGATNMAKALNIPTFSIFSPKVDKEGWKMMDDGEKHVSVHLKEYKPDLFHNKSPKKIKKEVHALYSQFSPGLFSDQIHHFCANELN